MSRRVLAALGVLASAAAALAVPTPGAAGADRDLPYVRVTWEDGGQGPVDAGEVAVLDLEAGDPFEQGGEVELVVDGARIASVPAAGVHCRTAGTTHLPMSVSGGGGICECGGSCAARAVPTMPATARAVAVAIRRTPVGIFIIPLRIRNVAKEPAYTDARNRRS